MPIDFSTIAKTKMAERSPIEAAQVIRSTLMANSDHEQWLHRDLLLAGWCLTEAPSELKDIDAELVDEILDRLVKLELSNWHHFSSAVIHQLESMFHQFGTTPFRMELWERLKHATDRIDRCRFLIFQEILQNQQSFSDALLNLFGNEDSSISECAPFYIAVNWEKMQSERLEPALVQLVNHPHERVRLRAIQFIQRLGKSSEAAVAVLLPLVNYEHRHFPAVCAALGKVGYGSSSVTDSLLEELATLGQSRRWTTQRSYIALALGEMANQDQRVIPVLIDLLQEPYFSVQPAAAKALIALDRNVDAAIQLIPRLQSPDVKVRSVTTYVLAELQNTSSIVVKHLQNLLSDAEPEVRYAAVCALERLGISTPEIITDLMNLLADDCEDIRCAVVRALWALEPKSDIVFERLIWLSRDKSASVRSLIPQLIGEFTDRLGDVENALLNLLDDEDDYVRSEVIQALEDLGNLSEKALNQLLRIIQTENDDLLWHVAGALGELGHYSQPIQDALLHLSKRPKKIVRSCALEALGKLNGTSDEIMTALLEALSDEDVAVRDRAQQALIQKGKRFHNIVLQIAEWINCQTDDALIGQAIDALWSIVVE